MNTPLTPLSDALAELSEALDNFSNELDDTELDSETHHLLFRLVYEIEGALVEMRRLLRGE